MIDQDTIAAIATPPGKGGIGIVRISGPDVQNIANELLGCLPPPRQASLLDFRDASGETIDQGVVLYFNAPNSFTGEDVLELQGHGGPVVLDLLLNRVVSLGARLARPGEFSERAFLNDKMDLVQAEAVADLIDAASSQAARAAQKSLQGEFSNRIRQLVEKITELRMHVEAAIDFPEEEIDFLSDSRILDGLQAIQFQIVSILENATQGNLLREGMTVVLSGQPNVGKSSLLNQLAGQDRAIVTEIPGTTRDVLVHEINIDGMPVHIVDTAGLRESTDPVEQEGIRRAWKQIRQADIILLVVDDTAGISAADHDLLARFPKSIPVTIVHNKIDLSGAAPQIIEMNDITSIYLSATENTGIENLTRHLKQTMGYKATTESVFLARRRHLEAIRKAQSAVQAGVDQLQVHHAGDLLAEDLRQAQMALAEITGEVTADELLGRIFSSFCIGK